MAHVELPVEELEPIVEAIEMAFEPLKRAMPSIIKIPEEISRITEKISQDLESGIPERTVNAVEKIAENPELVGPPVPELMDNANDNANGESDDTKLSPGEAEEQLKIALAKAEQEKLDKLNAQLQLLIDNGIPAKIDEDNKLVKLTEKEIKETQKQFIQNEKEEILIREQIETIKKSDMTAEKSAKELDELNRKLDKSAQKRGEMQKLLGDKVPVPEGPGQSGFVAPAAVGEIKSIFEEQLMAGPNAFKELKNSFVNNIGAPIKSLINLGKKQTEATEDLRDETKSNNIFSKAKTLLIVGGVVAIAQYFTDFLMGDGEEEEPSHMDTPFGKDMQERYNELREQGVSPEEAEVIARRDTTKKSRENMIDVPGLFNMRDEKFDIMNDETFQSQLKEARMINSQRILSRINDLFRENVSGAGGQGQQQINIANQSNTKVDGGGGERPGKPHDDGQNSTISQQ